MDLLDIFIETFTPYLFDFDASSNQYWSRESIFSDSNEILCNDQIFGFILSIEKSDIMYVDEDILKNVTPVAINILSHYRIIYNNLFTSGRPGDVFIPLIPIKDANSIVTSFKYPSYYTDSTSIITISLPPIEDVINNSKILVIDVYNFIIGYFLHYDYLNIKINGIL